ncbi:hypothetical protein HY311_02330 [Candidatus Nomurabacteria bacterium]|nr:hypothetical protein [Candidatus Nomurabacteria bacterium]
MNGEENKKINNIEKLVVTIATNVLKLTDKVDNLETKVDNVQLELADVKKEVTGVKNQLEGTNKRIDDLAVNRVKCEYHDKLESRVSLVEKKVGLSLAME